MRSADTLFIVVVIAVVIQQAYAGTYTGASVTLGNNGAGAAPSTAIIAFTTTTIHKTGFMFQVSFPKGFYITGTPTIGNFVGGGLTSATPLPCYTVVTSGMILCNITNFQPQNVVNGVPVQFTLTWDGVSNLFYSPPAGSSGTFSFAAQNTNPTTSSIDSNTAVPAITLVTNTLATLTSTVVNPGSASSLVTGSVNVSFKNIGALRPNTDFILVTLPVSYGIPQVPTLTVTAGITASSSGYTLICSGQTGVCKLGGFVPLANTGLPLVPGTTVSFQLGNLVNPYPGKTSDYTISTMDGTGASYDSISTITGNTYTVNTLSSVSMTSSNLAASGITTLTFQMTCVGQHSNTDLIQVTLPSNFFPSSVSAVTPTSSGLKPNSYSQGIVLAVSNRDQFTQIVKVLTLSNFNSFAQGTTLSFSVNGITNPTTVGALTLNTYSITITNAAGVVGDQALNVVASLTLTTAPATANISTSYSSTITGAANSVTFTITPNVLVAAGYSLVIQVPSLMAISSSGVTLSNFFPIGWGPTTVAVSGQSITLSGFTIAVPATTSIMFSLSGFTNPCSATTSDVVGTWGAVFWTGSSQVAVGTTVASAASNIVGILTCANTVYYSITQTMIFVGDISFYPMGSTARSNFFTSFNTFMNNYFAKLTDMSVGQYSRSTVNSMSGGSIAVSYNIQSTASQAAVNSAAKSVISELVKNTGQMSNIGGLPVSSAQTIAANPLSASTTPNSADVLSRSFVIFTLAMLLMALLL